MRLRELKEYFSSFDKNHTFEWSLSEPFSWRGSYNEVCFRLNEQLSTASDNLAMIDKAYTETFFGYKGGKYQYNDFTPVNFEEDYDRYTDGGYVQAILARIEATDPFVSEQHRLIHKAFV